ncbi:cleavage and polyadenylation specificity factor subunit 4-like [Huso huso]|uniref:Cleavage and polyadenylation specificity factor subunit 4-like n=1 Tax=Huso huso TaxID=61971 RepID=A0ABR0Z4Y4_HUSHU
MNQSLQYNPHSLSCISPALLASASMMIDMALLARHQNLLLQEITPFPHLSTTMSIVHYQLRQLQEAGTSTRGSARPIHLATCYKVSGPRHCTRSAELLWSLPVSMCMCL